MSEPEIPQLFEEAFFECPLLISSSIGNDSKTESVLRFATGSRIPLTGIAFCTRASDELPANPISEEGLTEFKLVFETRDKSTRRILTASS